MVLLPLIFYGTICGVLGLAAPQLQRPLLHFSIGVSVGLFAAGLLPLLRRTLELR